MRDKKLKIQLPQGQVVLAMFMNCTYSAFIEICGYSGFDFAIIDMEHGALYTLVADDIYRGADCVDIAPLVHIRENNEAQIQRASDIGSAGVQVPLIETKADAEAVVPGAKDHPLGARG